MKASTRFLASIAVCGLLACSNVYSSSMTDTDTKETDTVEVTGIIYKEAFVNKGGRKIEGAFTIFLKTGGKDYFIKGCESSLTLNGKKLIDFNGLEIKAKVSFRKGLWDVCDGNNNAQSRYGDYVAMFSLDVVKDMNTYTYADGSGNAYKITADSIEYIPIKKENSSSGEYSGGEPVKKAITPTQFDVLVTMLKGIVNDKTIHIENREMMTGLVRVEYDKESDVVLFKKGDRMALLENTLKFVLGK